MSAPEPVLRMHAFVPASRANGPGTRAVLWVQGCTLACPGCFNPTTHERAGEVVGVGDLTDRLVALRGGRDDLAGLTVSGGEPLQQRPAVLALLERVRAATDLSVLMFTGYRWSELSRMRELPRLRGCVDVLVAGRYERDRPLGRGLRGSANQTVHRLGDRPLGPDPGALDGALEGVPTAEVLIGPDGTVVLSGVDPPDLAAAPGAPTPGPPPPDPGP